MFNQLTGIIPVEIGQLNKLVRLALSGNQLSGDIPDEIWNLTNLYHLYLDVIISKVNSIQFIKFISVNFSGISGNQLEGNIPTGFQII